MFVLRCSIKDSPIQLDHDSVSEGAFSEWGGEGAALGREGPRSVMAGGSVKGWLPDVAVVLWRRMLGSLGRRRTLTVLYRYPSGLKNNKCMLLKSFETAIAMSAVYT